MIEQMHNGKGKKVSLIANKLNYRCTCNVCNTKNKEVYGLICKLNNQEGYFQICEKCLIVARLETEEEITVAE